MRGPELFETSAFDVKNSAGQHLEQIYLSDHDLSRILNHQKSSRGLFQAIYSIILCLIIVLHVKASRVLLNTMMLKNWQQNAQMNKNLTFPPVLVLVKFFLRLSDVDSVSWKVQSDKRVSMAFPPTYLWKICSFTFSQQKCRSINTAYLDWHHISLWHVMKPV